jgi:glycosyltransferase involved in cell wall biosynthesis
MKRKLLLVNPRQFGYHITYFNYCKYLKDDFDITYLCCDCGEKRISEESVEIIYIDLRGNIIRRKLHFIKAVLKLIKGQHYYCIFIKYFKGCSVIPLIYKRKHQIHLDIVTGSISSKSLNRNLYNFLLCCESYIFKSVSIISPGLQKLLKVSRDAYILPMGANPLIVNRKTDHKISLLYIGTLQNRCIDDTVVGLGLFISENPEADVHYTIIGNGGCVEIEQIMDKIKKYDLYKHVELTGYIPNNDLKQYYEKANIGVSYVPITPWYEYQPAIKTFEYLMAGIPVIATGTCENKRIINEQNGLIITDNPESFANSLELLYDRIDDFSDSLIRESVVAYKLESIVSTLKEFICNQT